MVASPGEGTEGEMVAVLACKRAQMESDGIVEPGLRPVIFLANLHDGLRKPVRPFASNLADVYVLRRKAEIAGVLQRGTPVNRDLQLRSCLHLSAADLIEGAEQGVAAERCAHRLSLMKTRRRASASSG